MFKNLKKKAEAGFTIIEVMIVLAIAGLILVVVLVAIPQLQRSQRDNAKQALVSRVIGEIGNYGQNNNGKTPFGDISGFTTDYLGDVDISNPETGVNYDLTVQSDDAGFALNPDTENAMFIYAGGACPDSSSTAGAAGTPGVNSRKFAIKVQLERDGIFYCSDNN